MRPSDQQSQPVCPVCNSIHVQLKHEVKDYTVSGEIFQVYQCNQCEGGFTYPMPSLEEIGKYYQSENYISHSDTNKGLISRLYHLVRKFTLRQKGNIVIKHSNPTAVKLLDVGSGTGAFSATMKQRGWQVVSIEPDEAARRNALEIYGVNAFCSSHLYDINDQFDVITLWHVLEHVHDLHGYMKQFKKLLKSDGILIIAVPNQTSLDAQIYQSHWAAWDVPRHLYHFTPSSMRQLSEMHGFKWKKTLPMWFDSFYVSMLSEQYKKGSMIRGIWNGWRSNMNAMGKPLNSSSVIYIIRHN
jgi:SAM-dependent methyltransferase